MLRKYGSGKDISITKNKTIGKPVTVIFRVYKIINSLDHEHIVTRIDDCFSKDLTSGRRVFSPNRVALIYLSLVFYL